MRLSEYALNIKGLKRIKKKKKNVFKMTNGSFRGGRGSDDRV